MILPNNDSSKHKVTHRQGTNALFNPGQSNTKYRSCRRAYQRLDLWGVHDATTHHTSYNAADTFESVI